MYRLIVDRRIHKIITIYYVGKGNDAPSRAYEEHNIEYERLRGNAADSPLVKDQGSKHQYMFMFAIVFEIAKF